ncbi:hypothetical protein [Streptomyces sp. NPDC056983]|uniref:hypothetical protein n=1 Tax=Streptomyces sp. NPDC056983 TaxID=3345987 RepID=UPI00362CB3DD
MRRTTAALGAALACTLLTSCSGEGGQSAAGGGASKGPATGGTVHVLANADFSHLDPSAGWDGGVNNFYRLIYRC